jgi:hypothetical protein
MAIYKKSVSVSGNWAKASEIINGTRAKIKTATEPIPSQFKNDDGSPKIQNVTKVMFQGNIESVNVSLNRATLDGLVEAFGEDSTAWIDKMLTAQTERMIVGGKRVTALYLVAEGFEVGEDDGGYMIVRQIPVSTGVYTGTPEISPDDIPF